MTIVKKLILLLCYLVLSTTTFAIDIALSINSKTTYKIVLNQEKCSPVEYTAASELRNYLDKITGAKFNIVNKADSEGKFIFVGWNKYSRTFFANISPEKLGSEEFIIKSSSKGNIYIVGGHPRGTLYGVFHFLDNILGVKWLKYNYTYIPQKTNLRLTQICLRKKPDYIQRFLILSARHVDPLMDSLYLFRNRINRTVYQNFWYHKNMLKEKSPSKFPLLREKEYGVNLSYAPPYFVHTIPRLIPAGKYFKTNPEWWELINGKRQNNGSSSSMCLSNEYLAKETAKNAIAMIKKRPGSKYISISEGDCIKNYCKCSKCQTLIKKYGAKSGLLLYFVNQVAGIIHKEYPDIIVTTLAYTHTEKAPQNIKAGKNILVRLCVWSASNAEAYNNPKNKSGIRFLDNLKKWKKVCPDIGVWDYVTTYYKNFIPHPNLHTIIPNLQIFHNIGVKYYLAEADHNFGGYRSGESAARIFLMSRGLLNVNASTKALLKEFTDAYYGEEAAVYIRSYWKLLQSSNSQKNYMQMFHGGCNGNPPYLRLPIVLRSKKILEKALTVAKSKIFKEHIEQLYMQIQFILLNNWKKFEEEQIKKGLEMPGTFEETHADFLYKTQKYQAWTINMHPRKKVLKELRESYYSNFKVTASLSYGGKAERAFDKNGKTYWNGGAYRGWLQIEFKDAKSISSIYTIFNYKNKDVTYEITGSLDGKKWYKLVPKRKTEKAVIIQNIYTYHPLIIAKDKFEPTKVKFIKTRIFKTSQLNGKPDWVVVREQSIR